MCRKLQWKTPLPCLWHYCKLQTFSSCSLKVGKRKGTKKKNNNNKEKKNETVKYYGLEGGSSLNNEALRLRETGLLNHSVCSGHDTSFNRSSFRGQLFDCCRFEWSTSLICKCITISWLWEWKQCHFIECRFLSKQWRFCQAATIHKVARKVIPFIYAILKREFANHVRRFFWKRLFHWRSVVFS